MDVLVHCKTGTLTRGGGDGMKKITTPFLKKIDFKKGKTGKSRHH